MVLSDKSILEKIQTGDIVISNYNSDHLNPNSYDMTLASVCKIYHPDAISRTDYNKVIQDSDTHKTCIDWADEIYQNKDWCLDVRKNNPVFELNIPQTGFVLQPNHLYLYSCNETIGVKNNVCATVMGKSSLGRLGLDIHVCAGFVDTGFQGSLVLEMRTIYPLRIYPGQKICQIKFEEVTGIVAEDYSQKSGSKYMNQEGVVSSQMHKNFKTEVIIDGKIHSSQG